MINYLVVGLIVAGLIFIYGISRLLIGYFLEAKEISTKFAPGNNDKRSAGIGSWIDTALYEAEEILINQSAACDAQKLSITDRNKILKPLQDKVNMLRLGKTFSPIIDKWMRRLG
jgi:hypothetical protein